MAIYQGYSHMIFNLAHVFRGMKNKIKEGKICLHTQNTIKIKDIELGSKECEKSLKT